MKKIWLFHLLVVLFISCEKSDNIPNTLFFNSFENSNQIKNIESGFLSPNTPLYGGDSSLVVSGGCVWPHVRFSIGSFHQNMDLHIECWAKSFDNGQIRMYMIDYEDDGVFITVNDTAWNYYENDSLFHYIANQDIIIEMSSGGLIQETMWVDLLKIEAEK